MIFTKVTFLVAVLASSALAQGGPQGGLQGSPQGGLQGSPQGGLQGFPGGGLGGGLGFPGSQGTQSPTGIPFPGFPQNGQGRQPSGQPGSNPPFGGNTPQQPSQAPQPQQPQQPQQHPGPQAAPSPTIAGVDGKSPPVMTSRATGLASTSTPTSNGTATTSTSTTPGKSSACSLAHMSAAAAFLIPLVALKLAI